MARAKPKWRRVLNARFLRWWLLGRLVRLIPALGRRLAFFPAHVGLLDKADHVLANEVRPVPPETLQPHLAFLTRCAATDRNAPDVRLPDGVVTGRRTALFDTAWIDMENASILLPGPARTVLMRGSFANWNATSARLARARIDIPGLVFAPLVTRNYFHVLLENGVRLIDLLESRVLGDAPVTVVHPPIGAVSAAMWAGIAALYPQVQVREVPTGVLVIPGQAIGHFPADNHWEWPPVTPELVDRLNAAFDAAQSPVPTPRESGLYITRRGVRLRAPKNEAALEAALAAAGAPPFTATDANHPDQRARFRAADVVVGVHGAGLTNIVFCRPGALVVEIFPGNFVKSTYWRLAQVMGLRYRPVFGGVGDYLGSFYVDVDAVLAALEG